MKYKFILFFSLVYLKAQLKVPFKGIPILLKEKAPQIRRAVNPQTHPNKNPTLLIESPSDPFTGKGSSIL